MANLLAAIGVNALADYFEFLDALRESGATNMFGAGPYLTRKYRGMSKSEASAVLGAWMGSFSKTLPLEDRAMNAIEKSEAA
jgi:hypothetical protein